LPAAAPAVTLSSTGHKVSPVRFEDPHFHTGYDSR
jgi:hypothetical protein